MKTIGLIGGLSWQSTQTYYQIINNQVNKMLGDNHSAKILMYSFDFGEIEHLQEKGRWGEMNDRIAEIGMRLENAGADCLLICSNTMHECADYLEEKVEIPLLHIADSTGFVLCQKQLKKIGLLGTKFLLQSNTYSRRLKKKYNIQTVIPKQKQIRLINDIIYSELVKGMIDSDSKKTVTSIITELMNDGIEGIILGCTELPLLINQSDCLIPVIDTTELHAQRAVRFALDL